jgi:cytochrome c oxidase assembly protein subunit 15
VNLKLFFSRLQTDVNFFEKVALYSARLVVLLILSGGFVRLSDSGLGCPDWPNCEAHSFTAPASFHPMVEDVNRFINAAVGVELILLLAYAWLLKPRRHDLRFWASFLVFMILVEALVGAIVVYSHLWPPFVMIHFVLGIIMVAGGVILHHSVKHPVKLLRKNQELTPRERLVLNIFSLGVFLVVLSGTLATSTGPHGGSRNAARFPFPFEDAVVIHASVVGVFAVLVVLVYLIFLQKQTPTHNKVLHWLSYTMLALLIQACIGVIQFESHVPIWLVEIHLLGVCVVVSLTVKTYLVSKTYELSEASIRSETLAS